MGSSRRVDTRVGLFVFSACFAWGWIPSFGAAEAGDHVLRLEGGVGLSFRVDDERDDLGGGFGLGYEYRALPALGLEARFSGYFFPFETTSFRGAGVATYYAPALGLRVHLAPRATRLDPWLAAAGTFVRTGPLNRGGLELGAGVDFALGQSSVALGPFVRYGHIFQPNDDPSGDQDGRILMAGITLSWAPPSRAPREDETDEADEAEGAEAGEQADARGHAEAADAADHAGDGAGRDVADGDASAREARAAGPRELSALDDEPAPSENRRADQRRAEARASRTQEAGGEIVLDATIRFDFRSWQLRPDAEAELREIIRVLRRERGVRTVIVVGHADQLGDSDVNQRISEVRAETVARFLRRNGARHVRFIVRGVADREPLVHGDSPEMLAPNRRVELDVVGARGGAQP